MERKIPHEALTPNRAQTAAHGHENALVTPLSLTDGGLPRLADLKKQQELKAKLTDPKYSKAIVEASRQTPGRVLH